jgi:hypothetical protein
MPAPTPGRFEPRTIGRWTSFDDPRDKAGASLAPKGTRGFHNGRDRIVSCAHEG